MLRLADFLSGLYGEIIDRSLLLTGTLLHDFAKEKEFTFSGLGLVTDYSLSGQLIGHLVMGAQEVQQCAQELGIPEEKSLLLQHMILSHHGEPEFGAAVRPMCAEAELLSEIDLIDSRMEIYAEALQDLPVGSFSNRIFAQQETKEVRAGQNLTYILSVENTGELPLENIEISSVFSQDNIKAEWKQEEGFTANGMQGIISGLKAGEIRNLQMTVQLTEEQAGELIHTVTVKAKYPGKEESIGCQKSVETEVIALKAAFEVEKTADRTQAYPGDTITYQICIRNTGERTLHSVLSTERFQNAGIQANFVRKEGVTLNSTGTQALIPQIAPGEAFALYATVTVPQYMASQELINEVIVTSDETGTQAMTSKANVELKETDNIVTVTPQPASLASQSYGYDSKSGSAYTTASKPRTGDETETALYIVLGIFAIMSGVSAFCYRKTKKQQK